MLDTVVRSSSSVAHLRCTMLRCLARQCSLSLQIVSTRRCAFALRWFCFPQNPGHFFLFTYLVILFIYFRARHSSALSFWVQQHEIIKVPGTIYHSTTRNITENSIRRYLLSLSWVAVQIWLLFRIVQCCGVWRGCARSPALSLLRECRRCCSLVTLLDTAVPALFVVLLSGTMRRCLARWCPPSQLIACTRYCVLQLLDTAVFDLSVMLWLPM